MEDTVLRMIPPRNAILVDVQNFIRMKKEAMTITISWVIGGL